MIIDIGICIDHLIFITRAKSIPSSTVSKVTPICLSIVSFYIGNQILPYFRHHLNQYHYSRSFPLNVRQYICLQTIVYINLGLRFCM